MQQATHDYWTMWNQFVLQGVLREDALPVSLIQSWRRCEALGLDPYGSPAAPHRQPVAKSGNGLEMQSRVASDCISKPLPDFYGSPAAPHRQPVAKSGNGLEMQSLATRDVQNAALL